MMVEFTYDRTLYRLELGDYDPPPVINLPLAREPWQRDVVLQLLFLLFDEPRGVHQYCAHEVPL